MSDRSFDVLAVGAHPDDVELGCGGTLAKLAAAGRRIGVVHLTRGEAGTRGTVQERIEEAERAADLLGVEGLEFLDCGDGALRTGPSEEDALIEVIRRWRPRVVLAGAERDRHPDHGRAHSLVRASCFYAGLRKRGSGDPHRPAAVYSYMQHDPFEPAFVVDVSDVWPKKLEALAAYSSQLHQAGAERHEPETKVASLQFRAAIEGRARHYGLLIGADFGEPFASRLPIAVADPCDVVPGGIL